MRIREAQKHTDPDPQHWFKPPSASTLMLVLQAIRDGVIEASLDHENGWMQSKDTSDIYATRQDHTHTANPSRTRIFKRLWSPWIDSKGWIPPAYVAWRAGTITLFLLGSLAPIAFLKFPAQIFWYDQHRSGQCRGFSYFLVRVRIRIQLRIQLLSSVTLRMQFFSHIFSYNLTTGTLSSVLKI